MLSFYFSLPGFLPGSSFCLAPLAESGAGIYLVTKGPGSRGTLSPPGPEAQVPVFPCGLLLKRVGSA